MDGRGGKVGAPHRLRRRAVGANPDQRSGQQGGEQGNSEGGTRPEHAANLDRPARDWYPGR
jgi:hypothetical protein